MPEGVGRVLADRYELRELLGRGGMGEVWAAWDGVVRRHVAVKLLQHASGMADGEHTSSVRPANCSSSAAPSASYRRT